MLPTAPQNVGVGQHLLVQPQPHELARSTRRDLVERVHHRLGERQDEDRAEEQQRGQDEQKSGALAAIEVFFGKAMRYHWRTVLEDSDESMSNLTRRCGTCAACSPTVGVGLPGISARANSDRRDEDRTRAPARFACQ